MSAEETLRPAPQLASHQPKGASARWRRRIVWAILGLISGYFLVICFEIVGQSRRDEARPADVIVVFGAAEYPGIRRRSSGPGSIMRSPSTAGASLHI